MDWCPTLLLIEDRMLLVFNWASKRSRKGGLPCSMCHRWENVISRTQFNTYTLGRRGWNSEIALFKSKFVNWALSFFVFFFFFFFRSTFHRITTVNLEAKFMFMLDHYTPKLLAIFQAKKGAAGERHRTEMNILLQVFQFTPLLRYFFPSPVVSLLNLIYFSNNWLFCTLAFNTRSYASCSLYSTTVFLNLLCLSSSYATYTLHIIAPLPLCLPHCFIFHSFFLCFSVSIFWVDF